MTRTETSQLMQVAVIDNLAQTDASGCIFVIPLRPLVGRTKTLSQREPLTLSLIYLLYYTETPLSKKAISKRFKHPGRVRPRFRIPEAEKHVEKKSLPHAKRVFIGH